MLLTDMALLHTHWGRLPDDRAKLYKEVIELLLLRWEKTKSGDGLQELLREARSEEHTSELQSLRHLVCRLLLEKNQTEDHTGMIGAARVAVVETMVVLAEC